MNLSPTKYMLPVMVLMGVPQLALAQSAASLSGLYACEILTNKEAQLTCFLTETAKLRGTATPQPLSPSASSQALTARPAEIPEAATSKVAEISEPVETVRADDPEKFLPMTRDLTPESRTLTIASTTTYGRDKYLRFTLANGEVWKQIDRGRVRLGQVNPDKLTIKKAAFGSFRARVNDKSPAIRVKRVK